MNLILPPWNIGLEEVGAEWEGYNEAILACWFGLRVYFFFAGGFRV